MADTDDPRKCFEAREDYFECLHHRKEVRQGALRVPHLTLLLSHEGQACAAVKMCCSGPLDAHVRFFPTSIVGLR